MKRPPLFLFLLIAFTVQAGAMPTMGIPPCGIASTYGMFVNLDVEVSLNDITQRYQDLFPNKDPRIMTLSHLSTLIQSFNLHTVAAQGNLATLDNSYLPAILCIVNTPSGDSLPVGHVVLLRSIQGNMATVMDYQTGVEAHFVPLIQLQAISEGK